MAKVYSPNTKYDGITARVQFTNGVGETEDSYILNYLKEKGYKVENGKSKVDDELEKLKEEAKKLGITFNANIGKAKLIEKIEEFKKLEIPKNPDTIVPVNPATGIPEGEDEEDLFEDEE